MTTQLEVPGPGMHALVIGVNHYTHLSGGSGEERRQYRGIGQLSSAVPSALRIARWLLAGRVDTETPLRSLQVLVNSPDEDLSDLRDAGVNCAVPTFDNIEQALISFKQLGDEHAENKLLLYFCGHGLSYSGIDTLLAENFGSHEFNHFRNAINVDLLLGGMTNCKAGSQLYLFDACRSDGDQFPPRPGSFGNVIINQTQLNSIDAKQVSIWASAPGTRAFGYRDGRPSVFAEAVLAALRGAAARRERSKYRIFTSRLKEAIDIYVKERAPRIRQVTDLRSSTLDFTIADLEDPPIVPITVCCADTSALNSTAFAYWLHPRNHGDPALAARAPQDSPWHVDVAAGLYEFVADAGDPDRRYTLSEDIAPPYVNVNF
ncbi:caspase family protein [Burkholderia cepacia]|uniref:caspase family protein n=1 Tax=Burkholderia cepacia TaxID=292 RepID=UPI0017885298|nr:caspase family protein [Burkholderia cepacia]